MVNKTNNDPLTLSASIYCPHQENTVVVTDVLGNTVCLIFTKQDMILVEFVLQFETSLNREVKTANTSAGFSYRPVHLVLQILVDPLKSCIATLDPKRTEKELWPVKNANHSILS